MQKTIYVCEVCKKTANDEKQLRVENWLQLAGGTLQGIRVWLDKPRKKTRGVSNSLMLTVGFSGRDYHFCSTKCLVKALDGQESI